MALQHMAQEDGNGGEEDLEFQAAVPEDVQAVMTAAEEGDAAALSHALANLTSGVDCEGEDGDRPLHIACLYGHLPCVQVMVRKFVIDRHKILLAAGANLEVRDEDGGLPLHDACAGEMMTPSAVRQLNQDAGYKEVVSMLLHAANSQEQRRRILDAFDVDGDTPLHHAARGNHSDVVQLLLDSGANPMISNLMGQCPADLADPNSAAQLRLLAAVRSLNAEQPQS